MGYFKELDIERLQFETSIEETENMQLRQMQPPLFSDNICSSDTDSLLDFVHAYGSRSVSSRSQRTSFSIVN